YGGTSYEQVESQLDAARKIAILASIAFNTRIRFEDVAVEGITRITPEDIEYAKALGYVVKLLAIGRDCGEAGVDVRVHPVFLPKAHPLASVNDVYNAIFVRGNAIGERNIAPAQEWVRP
ncbi:MAG: hypothetical protein ACFNS9_09935, partial [Actinomyces sp.]